MSSSLKSKIVGSILLVAGTQIGAGMLALPIKTGVAGFVPAVILFLLIFVYMLLNIFVLLEATLYCKSDKANIISIVKSQLGKGSQIIAWFSFLLLLYAISTAYIAGGGGLLVAEIKPFIEVSDSTGLVLFALVFASVAYLGISWIDSLNRLLMAGLLVSYVVSVFFIMPKVSINNLTTSNAGLLLAAIPVVIASFTSHLVIPSIAAYLDHDIKAIKKAVLIGSALPFVFYLVWEFSIVGAIPLKGEFGLEYISNSSDPLAGLNNTLFAMSLPIVANSNLFFSVFAMVTSFLGVILSLCDFLADGLNIKKNRKGRLLLMMLSCLPPLFLALVFPSSFMLAIGYAGGFIAILYGVLPSLVVYRSRYVSKLPAPSYKFFGGKLALCLLMAMSVFVIVLQLMSANHLL